jgi:hypothetical protein
MLVGLVDTIFCGTAFYGRKKENSPDHIGDDVSRMQTHQYRPTILLFLQIA